MDVLVAVDSKVNEGHFSRVAIYHVRKDGGVSLPAKFNGQLEGLFIRNAVKAIAADSAINYVDMQHGSSDTWRIARV